MTGDVKDVKDPMEIFQLKPPSWLPKVHGQADLGYHGFQPPTPQQEEDILSENNVKNGLVLGHWISAETFSAKDLVTQSLHENAIPELESLMSQIFARRNEVIPTVPPSSFKLPSRVTLNETKRQAWFADLANPDVPLQKLGKSVPHGAKGHDLLDLLQMNNVEIPRAVWFLRVFGGNETAGLRNKPNYNPTQYSVDWANVVTGYIKKQLMDIALPSAPRPGLNIKQTFKGVLSDIDSRERWVSRFSYCLNLLHAFYSEGLVDNRTFLSWLVQQMSSCNLAQTGFVARLVDEYLDGVLFSRALARPLVEACLNKVSEIVMTQSKSQLMRVEALLRNIVLRILLAFPDAFVSPKLWVTHSALIHDVIDEDKDIPDSAAIASCIRSLGESFYHNITDVRQRCESMLFRNLPARDLAQASWSVLDVQALNAITPQTDLESINFLLDSPNGKCLTGTTLSERIGILLVWSVTPLQYGEHRPHAVAALLRQWKEKQDERALRRECSSDLSGSEDFLHDCLFDWLDTSEVAGDPKNLPAVALLYFKLIKHNLFSFSKYTQRLIARGDIGLPVTDEDISRHRNFLKWIPFCEVPASLFHERKLLLYGTRVRESPEDLNEREIRKEIRSIIPTLFQGEFTSEFDSMSSLMSSCPCLLSATRFEQFRTIKQWLVPILRKFISNNSKGDESSIIVRPYCIAVELMGRVKAYDSMLDISLFVLERSSTTVQVMAVLDVLRRHRHIWASMNVTKTVARTLFVAHQVYTSRGLHCRPLTALLLDMDNGRNLEVRERDQLIEDITTFSHALHPSNEPPVAVPPVLPEILLLTQNTSPDAPSILANSLWYKYRTSPDWAWKVCDNTVASLRQIPAMISDVVGRRACALRYATFLYHVDQHLPDSLDKHILDWLLGPGKHELPALSADVWDIMTVVLLDLILREAVTTTTILEGLVYPAWQASAAVEDQEKFQQLQLHLAAANSLFERLLLRDDGGDTGDGGVLFADLLDIQRFVTRREPVYRERHFPLLLGNIPTLVSMEGNPHVPEEMGTMACSIRTRVSQLDEFRQGVYRDLDKVREAFEEPLKAEVVPAGSHKALVTALRLIFDDGSCTSTETQASYWRPLSSLLSPWKRAATAVELQFTLRQLGEDISREGVKDHACSILDELGDQIFSHSFTTEEADFVAVIAKGAGAGVSGKFLNNGMKHICKTLESIDFPTDVNQMKCHITRAGDILRLVNLIVQPFRGEAQPPQLELHVQEELYPKLCAKIEDVVNMIVDETQELDRSETSCAFFLARLLQFSLTTTVTWSPQAKQTGAALSAALLRLILMYGSGSRVDYTAFSLLMDTLYYVLDSMPVEPKGTAPDLFSNYPDINISSLPADMPLEFRSRIRTLLPYVPINAAVEDLAHVSRDASGTLVYHGPVQNRPWEWTEFLGDNVLEQKWNDDNAKIEIRNTTSLSLELFGTQATGDRLIPSGVGKRVEDNLRSLRNDLDSESVFKRDWRESRVRFDEVLTGSNSNPGADGAGAMGEETAEGAATHSSVPLRLQSRSDLLHSSFGVSPASSVRSRMSVASFHSPAQPSSVIDVDSLSVPVSGSSRNSSKRKATTMQPIDEDDDEIQIVDGPSVGSSQRAQKKPKSKIAAKPRVKKK